MTTENSRKRKEWEPKQVELKDALDLRHAALGPRGYKLKPVKSGKRTLEKILQAKEEPEEQPMTMDHDGDDEVAAPAVKRQKAEGVAYRNVSEVDERYAVSSPCIQLSKTASRPLQSNHNKSRCHPGSSSLGASLCLYSNEADIEPN